MKVSRCSMVLFAFLVIPASAAEPSAEFRCQSPFVRDASGVSLTKALGAANLAREEVFMSGDTEPVTVVFPKDQRRRLMVRWRDTTSERGIADIIIGIGSTRSVGGITIGASIVDVEKLNGRPFKISVAGGDVGFVVIDWQGGRLANLPGGCKASPEFVIDEAAFHLFTKEISDEALLSSGAGLRAAKPVVGDIFVSFPD
jgi:hypothetical protein